MLAVVRVVQTGLLFALLPLAVHGRQLRRTVNATKLQGGDHVDEFSILEDAYQGHFWKERRGAAGLSSQDAKMWAANASNGHPNAATYGEMDPVSVKELLQKVSAKPGEKYYDLGAGDGKTVMVAWLMGLDATGVELVPNRFQASCEALQRLKKVPAPATASKQLRFFQGSVTNLDFADADILFVQNLCFDWELTKNITRAAKAMRKGARILSYSSLPGSSFLRTVGNFEIRANYQETPITWTIQEKVTEPNADDANSEKLTSVPNDRHCEL